jgi:HSP20 family protein
MFGLMPRRREKGLEFLPREFASLFHRALPAWPVPLEPLWEMIEPWGFTVEENVKEVVVRAEVPGFEPGEIDVLLTGEVLTIRAEHKEKKGEVPVEGRHGKLERTVTLPAGIVPEKIEARYHNGVLEVHVPKVPEPLPRRIEVKT